MVEIDWREVAQRLFYVLDQQRSCSYNEMISYLLSSEVDIAQEAIQILVHRVNNPDE